MGKLVKRLTQPAVVENVFPLDVDKNNNYTVPTVQYPVPSVSPWVGDAVLWTTHGGSTMDWDGTCTTGQDYCVQYDSCYKAQ